MKKPISIFNYSIKNASSDSVDIHIDGDIVDASTQEIYKNWFGDDTSVSFKSFRNAIDNNPSKTYNVYINSGGGLVTDAMAMHDFLIELQDKGKTVNTIGRGIVASAATYILMAGKKSEMSKNSWFMVHNVSGGVWGNVDDIENYASTLRKFNNRTRDFYAEYSNMRKEDVAKLMNAETWMTADEAKEKGFIKNVTGEVAFSNTITADKWDFSNTTVLAAYNSSVTLPPDNSITTDLKNLLNDMKVSFKSIIDAVKGTKPENAEPSTIVNAIAEALTPAFETQATEIETAISNEMNEAETRITSAVTASFETRMASLETSNATLVAANAALKKANDDLELEVTNKLGAASNSKDDKAPVPIGSYNK